MFKALGENASDKDGKEAHLSTRKVLDNLKQEESLLTVLKLPVGVKWLSNKGFREGLKALQQEENVKEKESKEKLTVAGESSFNLPKMIDIPAGKFTMGDGLDSDNPAHEVTLSGFEISETQITQSQYEAIMWDNPSYFKGKDLPVETVLWDDAMEFCKILSSKTGRKYTLPMEAQ